MERHITTMILGLLGVACSAAAGADDSRTFSLEMRAATGYRADNLSWNIAGTSRGTSPDVLSELTWENLNMVELRAAAKAMLGTRLYARGHADYAASWEGKNQDSDYAGDGRTYEFSRSNNDATATAYDAALGVGYTFHLLDPAVGRYLHLSPTVGYSEHGQNLSMINGYQTFPATGAFDGLNSHYKAHWAGPWLGADAWFEAEPRTSVTFSFEYHWLDYDARANWNLRDEFQHPISFRHWAKGYGFVTTLGIAHELTPRWQLHVGLEHYNFFAENGTDRVYFLSGETTETRLNEVNWESTRLMVEARFRF